MRGINRRISGDPEKDWVTHTEQKYLRSRLPVDRMLSLGCGTGALERCLAQIGAFRDCDAYDISPATVDVARSAAHQEAYDHIHYAVRDVNAVRLEAHSYDVIWAYGALHHFSELESIMNQMSEALRPNGLLVFNEYVGPARFQFGARQKELANACLQLIPLRYCRLVEEAIEKEGRRSQTEPRRLLRGLRRSFALAKSATKEEESRDVFRTSVGFPSAEAVEADDPSESVRSNEILDAVGDHFEIVEKCLWGGNILQFLLSGIAGNFKDDDPVARRLIQLIFPIEETLLECGELESDFAYVVARPATTRDLLP